MLSHEDQQTRKFHDVILGRTPVKAIPAATQILLMHTLVQSNTPAPLVVRRKQGIFCVRVMRTR